MHHFKQCRLAGSAPLLPVKQTSQLLPLSALQTNDDAVTVITTPAVLAMLEKHTNRNHCPLVGAGCWLLGAWSKQQAWMCEPHCCWPGTSVRIAQSRAF